MEDKINNVYKTIKELITEIKNFVNKNGGFINTSNIDYNYDQIYAYVIDYSNDCGVTEEKVVAVKVKNNELYIATCPTSINLDINSKNDINNDDWYILNSFGDYVLTIPTTLSIAESIEQYVR